MICENRETRLEQLMRRVLPHMNIGILDSRLRRDILREFSELRAPGTGQTLEIDEAKELFWFDEPVLLHVTAGSMNGIMMRVPEDEAGFEYLVAMMPKAMMKCLQRDEICLRTACLDELTHLYSKASLGQGPAMRLSGPVHEFLLPSPGFFMSEEMAKSDVAPIEMT